MARGLTMCSFCILMIHTLSHSPHLSHLQVPPAPITDDELQDWLSDTVGGYDGVRVGKGDRGRGGV